MKSFATLALLAAVGLVEAKKKCPGHFGGDVPNLCSSHFPDKNSNTRARGPSDNSFDSKMSF